MKKHVRILRVCRRALLVSAVAIGTVCMAGFLRADARTAQARKPNVIIIFTDDQGYQDLGAFGSPNIKTPHIDSMAKQGMRFTDFYSAAPVCTPSRAALMTGCYPERVGNLQVIVPEDTIGLNPEETTIAEMLHDSGYATACIGKWHLGHLEEFLPANHGFDIYYGIPYSNNMTIAPGMKLSANLIFREGVTMATVWQARMDSVPLMRGDEVIEYPADQSTLTRRYTEEAVNFITANKNRPFFLYLPHTMPHIPLYASAAFEGTSEAGLYGDCVEEIDWSVGQILAALKREGLEKHTLIVYTSDNGPWHLPWNTTDKVKGNRNRNIGGSALPLRGYKFQQWEGGMREPTIMWWPGRIPAGTTCREVAGTIDLLPTIAALTGAVPPEKTIDGKSIVPLLEGRKNAHSPHTAYFYGTSAVRRGNWKLIRPRGTAEFELYDLGTDISENTDIAKGHPEIVNQLTALLNAHSAELKKNSRPFGQRTTIR